MMQIMDVPFRESFLSLWPPTASEMRERRILLLFGQDLVVVFVLVGRRSEKQLLRQDVVVFVFVVRSSGGTNLRKGKGK